MVFETPDNMGIQLPYSKNEWVVLSLENIANGRKQRVAVEIKVNTLLKKTLSVEELLEKKHIRIPKADELKELVWDRVDYDICYYADKYVITGHTPTQYIYNNPKPGYIYRKNNHIAIDCGAYMPGGRLSAISLDSGEEFYSYSHE